MDEIMEIKHTLYYFLDTLYRGKNTKGKGGGQKKAGSTLVFAGSRRAPPVLRVVVIVRTRKPLSALARRTRT